MGNKQLTPTAEQAAILESSGRRVRINARAGTGKTATMCMLANQLSRDGQKVLYLVYNKRAQKEAESKIPPSVARTYTIHGLSLKSIPANMGVAVAGRSLRPGDFLGQFFNGALKPQTAAQLTVDFLMYFLNSALEKMQDAVAPFVAEQLPPSLRKGFCMDSSSIISILADRMMAWEKNELPCPHDFYLKLAQQKGWLVAEMAKYDILLVDEAQDLSPVMLEVLRSFRGRVFAVGDSHQQIYLFRHAVDAMVEMDCDETFTLSLSFRFGQTIARLVTDFVREVKGEIGFRVTGRSDYPSSVVLDNTSSVQLGRGGAILARTNYSLFVRAVELLSTGASFCFTRSIGPQIERLSSIFHLSRGNKDRAHNEFLAAFPDMPALKEYAAQLDDRETLGLIRLVEKYGRRIPHLLAQLSKIPKSEDTANANGVVLTTIHGAKGLGFDEVYLCGDMFWKLRQALIGGKANCREEANMVYVAMTRAQNRLVLPPEAARLLITWPNPDHLVPRARTAIPAKKVRTAPQRSNLRLGACVRTPLGRGRLVIGGSKGGTDSVKLDAESSPVRLMKRVIQSD